MTPDVREREVVLPITGMTCVNCAATVERALRKTEGVSEVSVNFATERATVRLTNSVLEKADLTEVVSRVRFGVLEAEGELDQ